MLKDILFLQALLAHLDRLVDLLGGGWSTMREKLLPLLDDVINEEDVDKVSARVHRILRAFQGTAVEALTRDLFRQVSEQAPQEATTTRTFHMTDPITGQSRSIDLHLAGAKEGKESIVSEGSTSTLKAVTRTFMQAITPTQGVVGVEKEQPTPKPESLPTFSNLPKYLNRYKAIEAEGLRDILKRLDPLKQSRIRDQGQNSEHREGPTHWHDLRGISRTQAAVGPEEKQPPYTLRTVTTHPNLLGDDYVYLRKPYPLQIKLSDQPQPGGLSLSAPEFKIMAEDGEVVKKIQVKLTAPDFELDQSNAASGWMRELDFYPQAAASNAITFTLLPKDRFEERYFSVARVQFILNGQVLGHAARRLEVLRDDTTIRTPLSAFPPAPGYPLDERGVKRVEAIPTPLSYRPDEPPIHLTITLSETVTRENLLWEIVSPYLTPADLPPGEYLSRNLGAEEFVKHYLAPFGMPGKWPEDHMDEHGHLKPLSINILFSNLLRLRSSAPQQFWSLYALALERHRVQGGNPEDFTILFITADTHVPWELMPISNEVTGDKMPPVLGSAHRVGRWLLEVGTPTPEATLTLHGLSVAAPTYCESPLPQAQREKEFIEQRYRPQVLPNDPNAFITFMKTGQPSNGTGILHFAGHGDCCTDMMRQNWLVLTNREALYDIASASTDLGNRLGKLRPTVAFFNACNVGRAASGPLGSNGGWGRALLSQQYKGYIGPLWSVYDEHASDICRMFYTLALDERLPLGEVMRRIRTRFTEDNRMFTYLAYLYLGHPLATITYTSFEE